MTLLIIYALFALGTSFLCSLLESVLLSVTPSYVAALRNEGQPIGELLHRLKSDVDRPLAAILSVNTIAHTVGAVGVGAEATKIWGEGYVGVVSAVMTLAILFLTEIIPKTVGANYWRGLSGPVARILPILIFISYPLVVISQLLMKVLSSKEAQPQLSREEMSAMTEIGVREGVVDIGESILLQNVLRVGALRVRDIMTPRTVLLAVEQDTAIGEFFETHPNPVFSRIPIYREKADEIVGYVLKGDLLLDLARDHDARKLVEHRRDIKFVPEHLSVRELFELFVAEQHHIAVVVDEYGGIAGLVTMEDVVETLLGLEIVDESDVEQDMRDMARKQWLRRARRMGISTEQFESVTGQASDDVTPSAEKDVSAQEEK